MATKLALESAGLQPAPKCEHPVEGLVLGSEEIRDILCMYSDKAIFLEKAVLHGDRLVATFRTFEHPFLKVQPKHLTREHVLLFITQCSYILAAVMARVAPDWPLRGDRFVELASREQSVFTKVYMGFQRLIPNVDGVEVHMHCGRFREVGGKLWARFEFGCRAGFSGYCEGVIALDSSLRVPRGLRYQNH